MLNLWLCSGCAAGSLIQVSRQLRQRARAAAPRGARARGHVANEPVAATSAARETNEFATLAKARARPLAPFYTAVHDTYVARPEALVTGVALVPFVATLPFSKSLAVKNGAVAALLVGAPVAAMKVLDAARD